MAGIRTPEPLALATTHCDTPLHLPLVLPIQGEDVVAGIRTPEPIDTLARTLPAAYQQLLDNCAVLEKHYKDMQVGERNQEFMTIRIDGTVVRWEFVHVWARSAAGHMQAVGGARKPRLWT